MAFLLIFSSAIKTRFNSGKLWITENECCEPVSAATWNYCVGGYQVCRKWLRDRAGRELAASDLEHYSKMLSAIVTTGQTIAEIESAIDSAGGWPAA